MANEKQPADKTSNRAKTATDQATGFARDASERVRENADKAREAFQDHVVDPAKRAGEAMKASGERVAEGSKTIGLKIIDQASQNSHEAFEAMRAAAGAKDISEVMKIQADFLRAQGQRSMAQAREIGELIAQFGREAVTPLRGGGDRS